MCAQPCSAVSRTPGPRPVQLWVPIMQPSLGMGESSGQATSCHTVSGVPSPAMRYQQHLLRYSLPGHLQAEFEGAQVVDIHSHYLGQSRKEVLGLAGHVAHHNMVGQTL